MHPPSNTPEGILVRLKNKICLTMGIDTHILKNLIDRFLTVNFKDSAPTKRHYGRVNMLNEFSKNKMTIKVFFKFLKIINAKQVTFDITITTYNDKKYKVTENIDLFGGENEKDSVEEKDFL